MYFDVMGYLSLLGTIFMHLMQSATPTAVFKSESYTHLHQGMEMFLKECLTLWGFDL